MGQEELDGIYFILKLYLEQISQSLSIIIYVILLSYIVYYVSLHYLG